MRKLWIVAALLAPALALASPAQDKALALIKQQDEKNSGFKDYTAAMVMTLKTASGDETVRSLRSGTLEVNTAGDGDKSYMIFDKPADVRGTAILTHSHVKNDDQWLFLPAVKRVKRLNSNNKSGAFMGSEFAYEDLSAPIIEKYTYTYLREEKCGDMQCHVIERVPAYENSGYTKNILWIDTKELRTLKIEYYDRKSALLKTLSNSNFKLYKNKFWRAETGTMVNHQNNKSTVLMSKDMQFGVGLKPGDFEPEALEKTN